MPVHEYRKSIINGVAAVIFAVVFSTALAGFVNEHGKEWFMPAVVPDKPSEPQFVQWTKAIAARNDRKALLLAGQIAQISDIELPWPDYIMLFQRFNLAIPALTSDFCSIDLARWRDALAARALHSMLIKEQPNPLAAIFHAVIKQVKPLESPALTHSIMEIWTRRSGMPNDRLRLLAELARFSGYETTVIYLTDVHGKPFYALAELRRGAEYVVADILYERLYQGVPLETMPVPSDWHSEIKMALTRPKIYLVPAELSDYRNAENRLNIALNDRHLLPDAPILRLKKLISLKGPSDASRIYSYWGYPLESALTRPDIPPVWRKQIAKKP